MAVFSSNAYKKEASPSRATTQLRTHITAYIVLCACLSTLLVLYRQSTYSDHILRALKYPDLYEASISDLQAGLEAGTFTSVDLVRSYLSRIKEVNYEGPSLRAVLETNPYALSIAAALDEERRLSGKRSMLHGIPVLIKDNIATDSSSGMNTTAGSYALVGSIVSEDAPVIKRLKDAGAIILGKTNLSEFAESRAFNLPPGWSAVGGQCSNAFFKNADPKGSSSGSAVAVSIGLAAAALGTETDTSIVCPSSNNNVVGIKPTTGRTSRSGVIMISEHQDSVGPITRSVSDGAIILSVIAGKDSGDNYTLAQPEGLSDYTKALNKTALKGRRIGVPPVNIPNMITPIDPSTLHAFEKALQDIESLGATIVWDTELPFLRNVDIAHLLQHQQIVCEVDFKIHLNSYLANLEVVPTGTRSLGGIIAFIDEHPDTEKPEGHESTEMSSVCLTRSEATTGRNSSYHDSLHLIRDASSREGIDAVLRNHKLDALVAPSLGWLTGPSAMAGYPVVTVPMGFYPEDTPPRVTSTGLIWPAPGVPIGISFFGTAWSEYHLVGMAYAYEQKTQMRLKRRARHEATPFTQL